MGEAGVATAMERQLGRERGSAGAVGRDGVGPRTWQLRVGRGGEGIVAGLVYPFESEAAIEHVFSPLRVRLHTIVLIRISAERGKSYHLCHHGRRFFALLHEHGEATKTGLPEFVLTDKDTPGWGRPEPYEPTDVLCQCCEEHAVRLFRKRAGEIEKPPSSQYEQNPRSERHGQSMREPWARPDSRSILGRIISRVGSILGTITSFVASLVLSRQPTRRPAGRA